MSRAVEVMLIGGSGDGVVAVVPEGSPFIYLVRANNVEDRVTPTSLWASESTVPDLTTPRLITEVYRRVSNDFYRFDRIDD